MTEVAHEGHPRAELLVTARSRRARVVLALGPITVLLGIVWACWQPYRLTLLHPHGQSFWWLVSEPPLYVVLAGIVFRKIARGLLDDLERVTR